jgi:hypothetical protein
MLKAQKLEYGLKGILFSGLRQHLVGQQSVIGNQLSGSPLRGSLPPGFLSYISHGLGFEEQVKHPPCKAQI